MAQFGIDATGTYQVQNAVTPQAGVVDQSGEMLLRAAGTAIQGGLAMYKTKKISDIQQEAEAAVATEVGVLQDIFKDGKEPPSLQEYRDSLSRANQAIEIGGLNVQDRATLRVKSLIRKKSSENPWFAQAYAQIGQQVLSNYNDQLSLYANMENALQKASVSGGNTEKAIRKQAEALQAQSRLNPKFVIATAPIEQVQDYILRAQDLSEKEKTAKELRDAATAAAQERAARASERTAVASETTAQYTAGKREGEQRDSRFGSNLISRYNTRTSSAIEMFATNLNSGQLIMSEEEIKKDAADKIRQLRSSFQEEWSSYPWTDTTERNAVKAIFEDQVKGIEDIFTGNLSDIKIRAQQLDDIVTRTRLDAFSSAPTLSKVSAIGGAPAVGAVISAAINNDESLQLDMKREFGGLTGAALDNKQVDLLVNSIQSGNLDNVPTSVRPSVQSAAIRTLRGNADPNNPINMEDPATWGKTFLVATNDSAINYSDSKVFTEDVLNSSFVTNFDKLKTADRGIAGNVAQIMLESFPDLATSLVTAAQAIPIEKGTLNIDRTTGEFFVERGTGDPTYANRAAQRLNNLMNAMEAVSVFDRRVQGVNPKLWYAENILGIKGLLGQPAQEQPQ